MILDPLILSGVIHEQHKGSIPYNWYPTVVHKAGEGLAAPRARSARAFELACNLSSGSPTDTETESSTIRKLTTSTYGTCVHTHFSFFGYNCV